MIQTVSKILIIDPLSKTQNGLIQLLKDNEFVVEIAITADEGIQLAIQQRFDVVICQQNLKDTSGFKVYAQLEDSLLKYNSAFFLVMEKFESEDVLIGLELGIDNFIFQPLQKQSILNKIDKQLQKRKEYDFIESRRWIELFELTPDPMFIVENNRMSIINDSCENLLNLKQNKKDKSMFFEVFDIDGNGDNKMNLRKLENGLVDHCELNNVKLPWDSNRIFSISAYKVRPGVGGKVFAEIVECSYAMKESLTDDNYCPINGVSLKYVIPDALPKFNLTPREKEVFELSSGGLPIKQIAVELNLSERTVEKHRSNIMKKTKTHSFIEAILKIQKVESL